MSKRTCFSLFVLVASAVMLPSLFAQDAKARPKTTERSSPTHFMVAPEAVKWTAPPEGMIRGTPSVDGGSPLRYAPLEGDPMKPGAPFTILLACSDGYIVAPHWHPTDENLAVLSGTFALGKGDKFDRAGLQAMPTGSYGFMPHRMHHFGLCKGETRVLVYGIGPFQINFIGALAPEKAKPSTR